MFMLIIWLKCDSDHSVTNWKPQFLDDLELNWKICLRLLVLSCVHRRAVFQHLYPWSHETRKMLRFPPIATEAGPLKRVNGDKKEHNRRRSCLDPSLFTHQLWRPRWLCQSDGWEWHHWTAGGTGNCGSWGISRQCGAWSRGALWTSDGDAAGRGGLSAEPQDVTWRRCTDIATVSRWDLKAVQF